MKKQIRRIIRVLIAIEVLFVPGHLYATLCTSLEGPLRTLLDLDGEATLPAWFSTIQLFSVSLVSLVFCCLVIEKDKLLSWVLLAFPALFMFLSFDEYCGFHEWVGRVSDKWLNNGDRSGTMFHYTGIWMFVLGIPLIAGAIVWLTITYKFFINYKKELKIMILGFIIFLGGALGIEAAFNFVSMDQVTLQILVACEEFCEMFGVTTMLYSWSLIASDLFIKRYIQS